MMRLAFTLLASLLLALPAPASAQEPERLRIHGSNVLGQRVMPALVQAWLEEAGYVQESSRNNGPQREIHASRDDERLVVEILSPGSATAFASLIGGKAEVGMSARPPNAKELDDAWLLGRLRSPDQEFVVGLDGLAILVHPDNPVPALSREQLQRIFSGRVRDWSQVGGRQGPIRLVGRGADTGAHELLSALLLDGARQAPTTAVRADAAAISNAVAADAGAIGYVPVSAPERAGVRALPVSNGGVAIAPTLVNVLAEDYPLTRRLYLYGGQLMSALGRSFANYAVSPEGQQVVAGEGMLALTPQVLAADPVADAGEEYSSMLAGAQRLGLNLRFGREYTLLDSRGMQDMERLVAYMNEPANRGRELLLMAFASPDARHPARALFLSQDRVDFVADLLGEAGVKVTRRRGFGGRTALVPGEGDQARFVNERVEVWMR